MKYATIKITRHLAEDGDLIDKVRAETADGEDLPLTEALGMLRLAEDTLIRERMGDDA